MGAEARAKQVGKYNVCVTLVYLINNYFVQESIDCKTWNHLGVFLALELFDGTLRVINLRMYHSFTISSIESDGMKKLEDRN